MVGVFIRHVRICPLVSDLCTLLYCLNSNDSAAKKSITKGFVESQKVRVTVREAPRAGNKASMMEQTRCCEHARWHGLQTTGDLVSLTVLRGRLWNYPALCGLTFHSMFSYRYLSRARMPACRPFHLIHWFGPVGKLRVLRLQDEALAQRRGHSLSPGEGSKGLLYSFQAFVA